MNGHFQSHFHHLLVELQRIDGLVRQYVARVRGGWQQDEYQGLFISEQEIDELLSHPLFSADRLVQQTELDSAIKSQRHDVAELVAASQAAGIDLRLPRLAALFSLIPPEMDALLICLAGELDLRFEKLFAYAQDDVTKKQPRVDLILNVLFSSLADRLGARSMFSPAAPLLRHQLVELSYEPGQPYTTVLGRFVHLQRRMLDFLLGSDEIDERLLPYAAVEEPRLHLDDLTLSGDAQQRLAGITARWKVNGDSAVSPAAGIRETLFLQGTYGSGRRAVAKGLCSYLGSPLLVVDVEQLVIHGELGHVPLIFRESQLQNAVLFFRHWDACLGEDRDRSTLRDGLLHAIREHPGLVCLAGEVDWEPRGQLGDRLFIQLTLPTPDYATRAELWRVQTQQVGNGHLTPADIDPLANKFTFTPGQIQDSIMAARGLAAWRAADEPPTLDEIYAAARAQSTPILNSMARKITPRFGWDDIVLVPDSLTILHEISNTVKNRHIVYGQWGFERKLASNLGLNVLFAGESGTGKTMAADILAGELGLDLYKIDLSGIVSKYIGETEKNLDRIFTEARTSNAILFFDEADSIFGKRSEVRDSHDRYANIEVSYLLQKMEEYDGVVILATNLRSNMDDAFVRRMHAVVDFPMPEAEHRLRIWRVHFPADAPCSDDLDLKFLADRFKIAGGNIRNIVLGAAFLAAEDDEAIHMKHLVRASRRELQKMGRLVREIDFGRYYQHINGGDGHAA